MLKKYKLKFLNRPGSEPFSIESRNHLIKDLYTEALINQTNSFSEEYVETYQFLQAHDFSRIPHIEILLQEYSGIKVKPYKNSLSIFNPQEIQYLPLHTNLVIENETAILNAEPLLKQYLHPFATWGEYVLLGGIDQSSTVLTTYYDQPETTYYLLGLGKIYKLESRYLDQLLLGFPYPQDITHKFS